jgi:UrcA family protein
MQANAVRLLVFGKHLRSATSFFVKGNFTPVKLFEFQTSRQVSPSRPSTNCGWKHKETPMFKSPRSMVRAFITLALPVVFFVRPAEAITTKAGYPIVTVRYHDLNLDNSEGVAALYRRIHTAAAAVCTLAGDGAPGNRAFRDERQVCINHAVASAVRSVHNERLSAYHWSQIRGRKHWSDEALLAGTIR